MLMSIWDDGYGISVPNEFQLTHDLSRLLAGFRREGDERRGYDLYRVRGWDYPALCETYLAAAEIVRREHVPAIVHVVEMTQPQGHSTSGSHERYKSKERLLWEEEHDPVRRMRAWLVGEKLATDEELAALEEEDLREVRAAQRRAWEAYRAPIQAEVKEALALLDELARASAAGEAIARGARRASSARPRRCAATSRRRCTRRWSRRAPRTRRRGGAWSTGRPPRTAPRRRSTTPTSQPPSRARRYRSPEVAPAYAADAPVVNGFEVLNACFDAALGRLPHLFAMGEDVGQLGDVNQGFLGLQAKYGPLRVSDTGIRETTILGQAIGMALRGLRPIAEIQYLDYVLYCLQLLSDDLATLRWRTARRPGGAGHRAHPRPPPGGHLALRLADGRDLEPGARRLVLRAAQHDPRRGLLQHAARRRGPGHRGRGAERLPGQGEAAGEHRRAARAARRAGGAALGHGRHRRDLRRLLPDRARRRRAAGDERHLDRDRGRPDPAALRSPRRDRANRSRRPTASSSSTRTSRAAAAPT